MYVSSARTIKYLLCQLYYSSTSYGSETIIFSPSSPASHDLTKCKCCRLAGVIYFSLPSPARCIVAMFFMTFLATALQKGLGAHVWIYGKGKVLAHCIQGNHYKTLKKRQPIIFVCVICKRCLPAERSPDQISTAWRRTQFLVQSLWRIRLCVKQMEGGVMSLEFTVGIW